MFGGFSGFDHFGDAGGGFHSFGGGYSFKRANDIFK